MLHNLVLAGIYGSVLIFITLVQIGGRYVMMAFVEDESMLSLASRGVVFWALVASFIFLGFDAFSSAVCLMLTAPFL